MAEVFTRRLLKVFGVTVTDFQASSRQLLERARELGEKGGDPEGLLALIQELTKLTLDLNARWMEVSRLLFEEQGRAYAEMARILNEVQGKG